MNALRLGFPGVKQKSDTFFTLEHTARSAFGLNRKPNFQAYAKVYS